MRVFFFLLFIIIIPLQVFAQAKAASPLAKYSTEWNAAKYRACNTAAGATYMTDEEKAIIYILNLARAYPKLFCETVVKPYSAASGIDTNSEHYYRSLVKQMMAMGPLGILKPDAVCFASAECHAESSGRKGYVGHERQSEKCRNVKRYNGECCSYGTSSPIGIVVTLLVDEDVESLGHRDICLGRYTKIGVAKRPHDGFHTNTVLDLLF